MFASERALSHHDFMLQANNQYLNHGKLLLKALIARLHANGNAWEHENSIDGSLFAVMWHALIGTQRIGSIRCRHAAHEEHIA